MARFFRIIQDRWVMTAMDGEGARRYGGRWNHPGVAAVYLAESRALAALEILVHAPREALQVSWKILEFEIPAEWLDQTPDHLLPKHWRDQPSSMAARDFGSRWIAQSNHLALRLPSAIIPEEHVILLNPAHPRMKELAVPKSDGFSFDPRLVV
jgi:RES domain-containing protein